MGNWLMENGERTSVMGDFAYDADNGAWCELGSTEGSTPVWWRSRGHTYGSGCQEPRKDALVRAIEECEKELEKARRIEALEAELDRVRKKCSPPPDLADAVGGFNWLSAIGGIMFYLYFSHAPAQYAAHVNTVTLIIFSPLVLSAISVLVRALYRPFAEANRERASRIKAEIDELKGDCRNRAKTAKQLADELAGLEGRMAELDAGT